MFEIPISSKITQLAVPVNLIQGDNNPAVILFKVNQQIQGVNFIGKQWRIKVVDCCHNTYYETDNLQFTEGATIDVIWEPDGNYTGKPTKKLCVTLEAYQGDVFSSQLKIDGIRVIKQCDADNEMTPDYWANFLAQVRTLRDEAQQAAEQAINIELHPVIIGQNGNYWNWDSSTGAYVDSGITPIGRGDMDSSVYDPPVSGENQGPVAIAGGIPDFFYNTPKPPKMDLLWSGTASVGDTINVANLSNYNMFGIRTSGFNQISLAVKNAGTVRGIGGFPGNLFISLYAFSLTLDETNGTINISNINSINLSSSLTLTNWTNPSITFIYGITT